MFFRNERTLLRELCKLNKFSSHLSQKELKEKEDIVEQIQLQAVCISELGRVVREETNTPPDKVIKGMELAFERTRNKWNGQGSMYFMNRMDDDSGRLTSYNLANMLKRISTGQFGIEKRIVKNQWHYMSNGYKQLLREEVIW